MKARSGDVARVKLVIVIGAPGPVSGAASDASSGTATAVVPMLAVPSDAMILDVGPQSIERVKAAIDDAATLVWNGPLGAFDAIDDEDVVRFDHAGRTFAIYHGVDGKFQDDGRDLLALGG